MKKIGFILESSSIGADMQVIEHLVKIIKPNIVYGFATMDNKQNLMKESANAAHYLFEQNCSLVFIIWDLKPAWPDKKDKLDCKRERSELIQLLIQEDVNLEKVCLICITYELETWLLTNTIAISRFLSSKTRKIKVEKVNDLLSVQDPKAYLNNFFKQTYHKKYVDVKHALKILQHFDEETCLKKLCKCQSFRRLHDKLIAI